MLHLCFYLTLNDKIVNLYALKKAFIFCIYLFIMSAFDPKVAVIVPVYNMARYLPECLESLRSQTLQELEIICVNDGSTDNSAEILDRHAGQDARIKVISHENCGVGLSRNVGIKAAAAEYIVFLDPDDKLPYPTTLETLYNKAIEHQVDICGGTLALFTDTAPQLRQKFIKTQQGFLFHKEGHISYKDYQFDYGFYRFIYSRKLLINNSIYFPPHPRFQDPPFMVNAFIAAGHFYALPVITYAYRLEHKALNWNSAKVAGLFNGLNDVWQMACTHNLDKLKNYVWERIREHFHLVEPLMTPEQLDFVNQVRTVCVKTSPSLLQRIFSIEKNFPHRRQRRLNILGMQFVYKK